jgi:hypothetical protein
MLEREAMGLIALICLPWLKPGAKANNHSDPGFSSGEVESRKSKTCKSHTFCHAELDSASALTKSIKRWRS